MLEGKSDDETADDVYPIPDDDSDESDDEDSIPFGNESNDVYDFRSDTEDIDSDLQ